MSIDKEKEHVAERSASDLQGHFTLTRENAMFLSGSRVCLLEAIDVHGSLSAAARSLPMSYKAA